MLLMLLMSYFDFYDNFVAMLRIPFVHDASKCFHCRQHINTHINKAFCLS